MQCKRYTWCIETLSDVAEIKTQIYRDVEWYCIPNKKQYFYEDNYVKLQKYLRYIVNENDSIKKI